MFVKEERPRPTSAGHLGRPIGPRVAVGVGGVTLWTAVAAALALTASLAGLFLPDPYSGESSTVAMLRAYDLVTVAVVVPGLVVSTFLVRRGSVHAQALAASLMAYLVYTYAFSVFGTGFQDLFLLHAAVMATSMLALVLHAVAMDVAAFADRLSARRRRGAAAVLGLLAAALGGMWTYYSVDQAITGKVPPGSQLVETDEVVHLGIALDLTLLVPLYAATAYLLWRGALWGYVLGVISLVAGILHQVSYIVAMPFQVAADVERAVSYDPGEPVIVLLYVLGAVLLMGRPAAMVRAGRRRS